VRQKVQRTPTGRIGLVATQFCDIAVHWKRPAVGRLAR
jgi:hypothetical protein